MEGEERVENEKLGRKLENEVRFVLVRDKNYLDGKWNFVAVLLFQSWGKKCYIGKTVREIKDYIFKLDRISIIRILV